MYGTLLHSVCTTSEGQPFPDFFQAGMLSALSTHSFSVLLRYHAKRGLQMAVIVTIKALHTLFSREKHVEVVLMISVGNVFQYLYFLHMYPYLHILFSYHIFHSTYSSSISYFLLSWLYNDLNNAIINGDFPEDYLFWISWVDSRDGKEGTLALETLMKYCNLRYWGGRGLIWHLGLGSSYFLMGGGALLRAWVLIQGKTVTKHQKDIKSYYITLCRSQASLTIKRKLNFFFCF